MVIYSSPPLRVCCDFREKLQWLKHPLLSETVAPIAATATVVVEEWALWRKNWNKELRIGWHTIEFLNRMMLTIQLFNEHVNFWISFSFLQRLCAGADVGWAIATGAVGHTPCIHVGITLPNTGGPAGWRIWWAGGCWCVWVGCVGWSICHHWCIRWPFGWGWGEGWHNIALKGLFDGVHQRVRPLTAELSLEIIQVVCPEHGANESHLLDNCNLCHQTLPRVEADPLVPLVSVRGSCSVVMYHGQSHSADLVIRQEASFPCVLSSLSSLSCEFP